jgi:hypothetical protein
MDAAWLIVDICFGVASSEGMTSFSSRWNHHRRFSQLGRVAHWCSKNGEAATLVSDDDELLPGRGRARCQGSYRACDQLSQPKTFWLPHPDSSVVAGRDDAAVGQYGHSPHWAIVGAEFEWASARSGRVPHPDSSVIAAGDDAAVGQYSHRQHLSVVGTESEYASIESGRIPHSYSSVAATADDATVGQSRHCPHCAIVSA